MSVFLFISFDAFRNIEHVALTHHFDSFVNNQRDALFLVCLFHFSTCFEQHSARHQENQLYQYIIWYMSLWK